MGFPNPSSLTDSELLEDLEAAKRILPEVMASEKVLQCHKDELAQHVKELIQEQEKRTNEEYIFPLSSFGIVDLI